MTISAANQLTRSGGASLAPAPTSAGLYFLGLTADGLDLRKMDLTNLSPLPTISISQELAPAARRQTARAPSAFTVEPIGESRAYGLGRQEAAPLLGGATAPSGNAIEAGIRLGDVVGRIDTTLVGSFSNDGAARGGAIATSLRKYSFELGGTLFAYEERPSEHSAATFAPDLERRGVELRVSKAATFGRSRVTGYLAGFWNELDPAGAESLDQTGVGLGLDWRPCQAPAHSGCRFR